MIVGALAGFVAFMLLAQGSMTLFNYLTRDDPWAPTFRANDRTLAIGVFFAAVGGLIGWAVS